MPESASLPKVEATGRYGAEVKLVGKDFGEAFDAAVDHSERTGSVFVHPYNHPHVIAGQGTVGLEMVEQMDEIGTVVVPIGGGGLISGVAAAVAPRVRRRASSASRQPPRQRSRRRWPKASRVKLESSVDDRRRHRSQRSPSTSRSRT